MSPNREHQSMRFLPKALYTKIQSNVTTEVYKIIVSNNLFSIEINLVPQSQSVREEAHRARQTPITLNSTYRPTPSLTCRNNLFTYLTRLAYKEEQRFDNILCVLLNETIRLLIQNRNIFPVCRHNIDSAYLNMIMCNFRLFISAIVN